MAKKKSPSSSAKAGTAAEAGSDGAARTGSAAAAASRARPAKKAKGRASSTAAAAASGTANATRISRPKMTADAAERHRVKMAQRRTKLARTQSARAKKVRAAARRGETALDLELGKLVEKRRRDAIPVDQPVALICQAQRSGGTLLRNLFDGHVQCHVHPFEWHIGYPRRTDWPKLALDSTPEHWWVRLEEEPLKNMWEGGVRHDRTKYRGEDAPRRDTAYPFLLPPSLHREMFADAIERTKQVRGARDILNAYNTALFNAWTNNNNLHGEDKRWLIAFAPRLAWGTGKAGFFSAYPDGRMISIIRDPYSWYASARGRQIEQAENDERLLALWVRSATEMIEAHETHADQVSIVRFEDLILNTQKTMRMLAKLLDITYADSLAEPTFNSQPVGANSSYSSNTSGVIADPLTRYKQQLSTVDQELIAGTCEALYEQATGLAIRPPVTTPRAPRTRAAAPASD